MSNDITSTEKSVKKLSKWRLIRASLWWRIWLSLIAGLAIYALCSYLYLFLVITPQTQAREEALKNEREQQIQEFRQAMKQYKEEYQVAVEHWRYNTLEQTPPPVFEPPGWPRRNAPPPKQQNPINPVIWLTFMLLTLGALTYPVARQLTKRLEKLQHSVEAFGSGNLQVRVEAQGDDEVAKLAKSFNASAKQIEKLLRQHKLLLAQISHELRTPLARLSLSAELVSDKAPEIAADLRTDIQELDHMVGELLLASRLDAATSPLQFSSFDALALAAEEASRTNADISGESIEMLADETLIRRALRNLLINAQRYAPEEPAQVIVSREAQTNQSPEQVCFTVLDCGPGISAEDKIHIFEQFFRGKNTKAGGTGLGLSLVQQIAQRHGGSVVCLDRADRGCQFELRIPVQPQAQLID